MICKYFLVKSHEEKEEIWPKVAHRYSELTGENVDRQDLRLAFKTFARVAHTRDKAFQREVAETGGGTNKKPGIYHVQNSDYCSPFYFTNMTRNALLSSHVNVLHVIYLESDQNIKQ